NNFAAKEFVSNDPWHYNRVYMQDCLQFKPPPTPQFLKRSKRNNVHLKRNRPRHCRRRKMIVDFSKLNMTDWILAPVTIDAGVCVGTCAFPLGKESNPTNHAVIQSVWSRYLRSMGPFDQASVDTQSKRIITPPPLPCCVPHELDDLPMLFFQGDNQVVLNHRSDMIVRSCGLLKNGNENAQLRTDLYKYLSDSKRYPNFPKVFFAEFFTGANNSGNLTWPETSFRDDLFSLCYPT
ncbi:hypothetical protein ACTXT7_016156, partial [Hymenolepis weldensis]